MNNEVTPPELVVNTSEFVPPIQPKNNEAEEHKSEGVRPREFVQQLEDLAEIKAAYQLQYNYAYREYGHISQTYSNGTEDITLGRIDFPLSRRGFAIMRDLTEHLDTVSGQYREGVDAAVERFNMLMIGKRTIANIFTDQVTSENPDLAPDTIKFNNICAQKVLAHLFPKIPTPENVQFAESPFGLLFAFPDLDCLNKFEAQYAESCLNLPVSNRAPDTYEHVCGGFATYTSTRINEQDLNCGFVFVVADGVSDKKIRVNHWIREHEEQHLIDLFIMYQSDEKRKTHLSGDARKTVADLPGREAKSRLYTPNSKDDQAGLKTEIFAFAAQNQSSDVAIDYLTARSGPYNYNDVLGPSVGPLTVEEQERSEEYKAHVIKGVHALEKLTRFYESYYRGAELSRKVAQGMLDPFPVDDWSDIEKLVTKYSSRTTVST